MSKSIAHIFGGEGKVKIMRLFIFNPKQAFSPREVAKRAKERPEKTRKELRGLAKAGLLKQRSGGYILNPLYPYLEPLQNFLIDAAPVTEKEITQKMAKTGSIKLILIAGVFLHNPESRVDILVVGDNLKHAKIISAISAIEAQLGKELRYAVFESLDFRYRISIYDKLIRDILDYPHKKILNKLGI
jgi:hypothetical protein